MPRTGDINPANPTQEVLDSIFGGVGQPSGAKLSVPVDVIVDLEADATVHSLQNPFDSDCLVSAMVNVTTLDATETLEVGVDDDGATSNDTLFDALDVGAATGVFNSYMDGGTNGIGAVLLNKKGGANDFLVWTASAGTDTLVGQIIFTFHPLNEG